MDQLLPDGCSDHLISTPNKLARKRPKELLTIGNGNCESTKQKKAMHRDVERLRRQEMAKQYALLRSILPVEYIKGKRSISDHVHQSVSYINHLQGRIKELYLKREKLKESVVEPGLIGKTFNENSNDGSDANKASVTVGSCWCGVEIFISSSSSSNLMEEERLFPLSKMVRAMDEQNLSVVSCSSAKVNQRLLYTIQCEVSHPTSSVDLSALQLMLTDAINNISG
ncbi:hypothetical protein LguiB_003583 [Lonicera macranthoides]